jgi:hypothetical protein
VFYVDVAKVDRDVVYVASASDACCKRLFKMFHLFFRCMFCKRFYLDVAYVLHILQEYVPMISIVSILCCIKCFYVASCKCFI